MELTTGPLDFLVEPLVDVVNFPIDQLKFVLCLVFSYPLAIVYRYLQNPFQKHIYTIGIGISMLFFCFGVVGLIHFIIPTSIMYGIFLSIPAQFIPKVSFIFMFAYLSGLHIYRLIYDYMGYKLDATSVIMVLVIKISTLGCNYYDGKRLAKESDIMLPAISESAIPELPNSLEYYSYLCYFPTFLSGPAFNFTQYIKWINLTQYHHKQYNPKSIQPPLPVIDILKSLGYSIILAITYIMVTSTYPMDIFFKEGAMDHMSMFKRYVYLFIGIFGVRCRYYFIWKLAEGAGIVSGLGFSGYDKDGKVSYNGLCNINVWKIESCGCLRDVTTYWNIKTAEWLKNYVYLRQTKNPLKDRVPGYALYLTNSASAFWHGFYPGYYLAFLYAAFTTDIARQIRTIFRPLVTELVLNGTKKIEKILYPKYYIYDLIGRFLSLLTFNYGFVTFVALSFENSIIAYRNLGFLGHIVALIAFVVLFIYNKIVIEKKTSKVDEKKK